MLQFACKYRVSYPSHQTPRSRSLILFNTVLLDMVLLRPSFGINWCKDWNEYIYIYISLVTWRLKSLASCELPRKLRCTTAWTDPFFFFPVKVNWSTCVTKKVLGRINDKINNSPFLGQKINNSPFSWVRKYRFFLMVVGVQVFFFWSGGYSFKFTKQKRNKKMGHARQTAQPKYSSNGPT